MRLYLVLALTLLGSPALTLAEPIGKPHIYSSQHPDGSVFQRVRLLGALVLSSTPVDGRGAYEISGLAWDADDRILYGVSDAGYLVHLRPIIENDRLIGIDYLAARSFLDANGRSFPKKLGDAESLSIANGANGIAGDAELTVSFEGVPRVMTFRPDGTLIREIALPATLTDRSAYEDANTGLEALAQHPVAGFVTAPERPLRTADPHLNTLYAMDGRSWTFTPLDAEHGSITDMAVAGDGSLMVLERSYRNIFLPVIFSVRKLRFAGTEAKGSQLPVEDIVRFSSAEGWALDNFEGIARQTGERYFVISDDNQSAIQRTILLYLEVLPQ